nr:Coq4 family protein [uncultured Hyphomonas sp.]
MISEEKLKARFLRRVEKPVSREELKRLARSCRSAGNRAAAEERMDIAAALAHAAFLAPDRTAETYDAVSEGWTGNAVKAAPVEPFDRAPEPVPPGLWDEYWGIVEDGLAGKLDALAITQRTAALGKYFSDEATARIAEMAHLFEGVSQAAERDMPDLILLSTLAACPQGSLGREFHDLIVDNKFDLEVLDRTEISVHALPQPLAYLNTRMLQAHDLWHITAGYETTALHEIAISAFQMAQFGHNYSAQFLSITAVISALSPPRGYPILMDTVTSAWIHGRETPSMILIPWEEVWDQPVETIRKTYGIRPYDPKYPADLIEQSRTLTGGLGMFAAALHRAFMAVTGILHPRRA